jgi:hypothetical protein
VNSSHSVIWIFKHRRFSILIREFPQKELSYVTLARLAPKMTSSFLLFMWQKKKLSQRVAPESIELIRARQAPYHAPACHAKLSRAYVRLRSKAKNFIRCRGRITGIVDGDTVKVLTAAKQQIRVRLAFVDAPEKGQAFGQRAKQAMRRRAPAALDRPLGPAGCGCVREWY